MSRKVWKSIELLHINGENFIMCVLLHYKNKEQCGSCFFKSLICHRFMHLCVLKKIILTLITGINDSMSFLVFNLYRSDHHRSSITKQDTHTHAAT